MFVFDHQTDISLVHCRVSARRGYSGMIWDGYADLIR
jgi:hypothetical protein